jgi:hypothetical protein
MLVSLGSFAFNREGNDVPPGGKSATKSLSTVDFPKDITRDFLMSRVGQSVEDFCTCGFGKKGDEHNHCAHYVSHVLGYRYGKLCSQMVWEYRNKTGEGRTLAVHDLFNNCPQRGLWKDRPSQIDPCLIFAVHESGISTRTWHMDNIRRKHVGIYLRGECFNYHNTKNEGVAFDGDAFFKSLYGKGTVALYGSFPP